MTRLQICAFFESWLPVLAVAIASALAAPVAADDATVLKLATAAPPNTPWASQIERVAAAISEESEGRLHVEPFFSSQLGTEADVLAQLARGRVELGLFTLSSVAMQAPELALMKLPAYYASDSQRACVQDDHTAKEVREILDPFGIGFGTWAEVGNGYLMSARDIRSVADVQNLTIGVTANRVNMALWRLWGANPMPISPAEATMGASTGLIDVYPTVYTFYMHSGLSEVMPVVNEINYDNGPGVFLFSNRIIDKLKPEDKQAIKLAFARFSSQEFMEEIRAFEFEMRQRHIASGGRIVTPTPEQLSTFLSPLPAFHDKMFKAYGAKGTRIQRILETAKSVCPA